MKTPSTFQRSKIFLLSAGHLINDSYNGFLAPILPILMIKYDLSLTLAAALATTLSISSSFIQPILGYLADKFSHRYFVILGPLLTAVFMSAIGLAPNYWTLILFLIFSGIGTAAFHPQAATMVAQSSGERRGFGMSIFVTGGSLGVALGPVIIMLIIKFGGLNYSFLAVFPGLIIAFLLFLYAPVVKPKQNAAQSTGFKSHGTFLQYFSIFLLTIVAILRSVSITTIATFSPLFLTRQNYSIEISGLSVTVFLIFGGLGAFFGGAISDRIGQKKILLLSLLFSVPFLLGFTVSSGILQFIWLAFAGFTLQASLPVTILMAQDLLPSHSGTVSSLMMGFCWGIAGLLLTPLGALGESIGLEQVIWGVSLLPLPAFLFVLPVTKKRLQKISSLDSGLLNPNPNKPEIKREISNG